MRQAATVFGVLEAFYGRSWAPDSRLLMTQWLPALGLNAYMYAPKADAYLRRAWQQPWPKAERLHLQAVSRSCATHQLAFHVGLSPMELYRDYNRSARASLRSKIGEIVDLGVAGLAILFDDMPGDLDSLSQRQVEICGDVHHWLGDAPLALRMCPTYYSDDPILDEIFGPRPSSYLKELAADLEPTYEVFWTGPQVCSEIIDESSIEVASKHCQGRIALWDNYPVNDSRARSPHLYIDGLSGRSSALEHLIGSHWCNAMNQPGLSLPALASLPALYGRVAPGAADVWKAAGIDDRLLDTCRPLAERTLVQMTSAERSALDAIAGEEGIAALELRDWLSGGYEFDPDCLTS